MASDDQEFYNEEVDHLLHNADKNMVCLLTNVCIYVTVCLDVCLCIHNNNIITVLLIQDGQLSTEEVLEEFHLFIDSPLTDYGNIARTHEEL